MVMVLHDVNLAARFCDHVLLLYGEGKYRAGPGTELLNADTLSELYRHPMSLHESSGARFFLPQ
jgi:iron complex transport system ATP-binding protein